MILWEACIEEIALEGLDGITLPTLWFRLQSRPDIEFLFDDAGKQWIWNFVRQRRHVLTFYQLPEPRPYLSGSGDDEAIVDERTIYPVHVITEGNQWGSCSTFGTRSDISETIYASGVNDSVFDAMQNFGTDRLVVVASQIERTRALFGPSVDSEPFFRDSVISRQHYAMLERIGRSRYTGVNAGSSDSLHSLFNVRAKDVFYVMKRFENLGLVKKQVASAMVNQSKLVTATVVMLTRYSVPMERSKYLAPMRKLVAFLEQKSDKRAPFPEVKELFGIATVYYVKKMLQAFPGIVRTTVTKIDAPELGLKKKKSRKKRNYDEMTNGVHDVQQNGGEETNSVDVSVTATSDADRAAAETSFRKVTIRHYELIGRLHLDEETGELLSTKATPLVESSDFATGGGDDDEDEAGGSLVDSQTIDWSRFNPYRTRVFETLRGIRQSGAQGIDNKTLRKDIGVDRKQMERLLNNLKKGTQFKSVVENVGKARLTKYVWSGAEHQAEQHYRKFEEVTGLDLNLFGDKERMMLGERNIQRLLCILERLDNVLVAQPVDFLRVLRQREQDEGYGHILDKKCLASLIKFLTTQGQLKTFITVLKEGALQRTVEYVCHKSIEISSVELQSKICSTRLELAQLNARRMGNHTAAKIQSNPAEDKPSRGKKRFGPDPDPDRVKVINKLKKAKIADVQIENPLLPPQRPPSQQLRKEKPPKKVRPLMPEQAWRRSHPAVQRQLQKRKQGDPLQNDTPVEKMRRKRMAEPDAEDMASFSRRRKMRAQFSHKERQMLLLMRAVSYVFYAGSRLWVEATVIRDLMHKYVPESLDKSSKVLVQSSSRDVGTNPQAGESMLVMAEQLQKNKKIKAIKKQLSLMSNQPEDKRWAFGKAFNIARKMFYGQNQEIDFDDINLNTLFQTYDVSVEKTNAKSLWPVEDAENETDVLENTAKRVVYSALSVSRRDGPFTSQLNAIYKLFPDTLLLRVVSRLRRNGMLVYRSKFKNDPRARKTPENVAPKKSGDLALSFFYRHFFYHHYHINLAKEAKALLETMKAHADEWHNVLMETPGNVATLMALLSNKQVYFDLTVPSNVVVYNDSEEARTEANRVNGAVDDDDDWPRVISATTNLLQSEDDADDDDLDFSFPSTSQTAAPLPIAVKTEPGTEAVHLACQSANKSLLCRLRQERLQACETSDARSISVRVRDLVLNSCSLVAKLSANFKENNTHEQKKVRDAMEKLIVKMVVNDKVTNENDGMEERSDDDRMDAVIKELLDEKGAMGMTEEEFRETICDDESIKSRLVGSGDVIICGVGKKRYVHSNHIQPWSVSSLRYSKENRQRGQEVLDDDARPDELGEFIKFMPRPWLKPDGTLNRPMLRWLCEGLFLRFMSMPGVTDVYIQEQFASVMDPWETAQLTEFLIDIGCLIQIEKEFCRRKPQLFGPPIVEKQKVISYELPMDATTKFAAVFEKTPMPDFVTSWLTGASGSDRGSVFGRRRLRPAGMPTPANLD